ncbi:unnamed protein product, partial [marine sediment metagenome]
MKIVEMIIFKSRILKRILILGIFVVCFCTVLETAMLEGEVENSQAPVYIVPIKGEIERGLVHFVRRSVREAEKNKAKALIIH